jgi:hypothetical protein
MCVDTGPVRRGVPGTRRSRSPVPAIPAPHAVPAPLNSFPSVFTLAHRYQKAHRGRSERPYNPHKVCGALARGFVQQGLSARDSRGRSPDHRGRADQTLFVRPLPDNLANELQ